MRILITGGCGYIGAYLIPYLAKHNKEIEELIIYDNLANQDANILFRHKVEGLKVRFIKGDILDGRTLRTALKGVDTVIHLASKITQPFTDVQLHVFDQVNNWGTSSLVDAVEQSEVKRFIYLSTIVIYGTSEKEFDEESVPEPITYYGLSKLKGEKHVKRLNKVECYNLRSANVYGYSPAMRIDSVINRFMFEAHYFNKVNKVSDGEQSRAFIHIDKLAHVINQVLLKDVPAGTYNVAEHNLNINQVLEQVMRIYPDIDVIQLNQDAKLEHVNTALPCKLFRHITLPERSLEDEIKEMNLTFSF